jgi:serine/threonine protein kinase
VNESQVFVDALKLVSPAERAAYLDAACAGDPRLRADMEALLRAHETDPGFLEQPAGTVDAPTAATLAEAGRPVALIAGRYKQIEPIGEGGMGSVWMAEQQQPVRRLVAVKLIRPGMDSRQVLARFEAERQALALMDHPNIAKVLDAGQTEQGRPYFVMELVKGIPITQFCDERRLTPRERLELFIPVCQAVQHAHQKGIIHRDIKPSNVLVPLYDGQPVPKVIDFGVAKAIGQKLTEATLCTGFGAVVGTPEYMSPEQAELNQLDVDTRSDIYALGVLLYELLTGTTPLDPKRLKQAAILEVLRVIREEEPQRPSTRLSTTEELPSIAASRNVEPRKLTGLMRGELDWIVMKALEKDRNRRYETANDFAMDVQHYLADEQVQACPPSAWYRFRKFVRRNKRGVSAGSLSLLALVAGVIGTTWGLIQAEEQRLVVEGQRNELAERHRALQAAHEKEHLLNERARQAIEMVMSETVIDQLTREKELRPEQKEFLDKIIRYYAEATQAAAHAEQERSRQARAYHRMGRMHQILGRSRDSENAYRRAVALGQQLAADFPDRSEFRQELASSHNSLGVLLQSAGRSPEAESAYADALAISKRLADDFPTRREFRQILAGIHNNLGNLLHVTGRLKEAEAAHGEALAIRKQLVADFPTEAILRRALAMSHNGLGWLFQETKRLDQAESAFRDALALQRRVVADFPSQPEFRLELAKSLYNLGNVLRDTGRPEEAEAARDEALVIFRQLVAEFPNRPEFHQELAERQ